MEYGPKFVISKPSISFLLQLVYLATAGPELGTAQPQLVYSYKQDTHTDTTFTD
jgi:hypothetical protein